VRRRDVRGWLDPISDSVFDALRDWESKGFVTLVADPRKCKDKDVCLRILKLIDAVREPEDLNDADQEHEPTEAAGCVGLRSDASAAAPVLMLTVSREDVCFAPSVTRTSDIHFTTVVDGREEETVHLCKGGCGYRTQRPRSEATASIVDYREEVRVLRAGGVFWSDGRGSSGLLVLRLRSGVRAHSHGLVHV